jgi:hypothetical protein
MLCTLVCVVRVVLCCTHPLIQHVEFTRQNMSTLVVPCPGPTVSLSRTIPGFLLDSDLVHPSMRELVAGSASRGSHPRGVRRQFRSVSVLEWTQPPSEDSHLPPQLSADHLGALDNAVERFSRLVQNAVSLLKAGDIQLLLCGGKVPSPARHYLREAGIVAVEMVPEDLLGLLAGCCATRIMDTLGPGILSFIERWCLRIFWACLLDAAPLTLCQTSTN